ncbi:DUF7210 family protein [Halomonas lysinitropha]|uniref:DUF7210 domain-containing protein n=1 Tax=Halomonas lysinitropha TaxID=2607506 RepID=A0A5K1I949_9GAMM|nr:hypothetical protein [Halomonas lysinitropha]VVZ96510.1 hypothetical protein HALO32_02611 [Halomonas lysinitropha]
MPDTQAQPADLVQVTLKKPHTHGGKDYQEGDQIKVRRDQVERLKNHHKV